MQAAHRGKKDRQRVAELKGKKIEEELGLEGTEEEAAQIARMQAAHRGKKDRQKVAEMKGKKIEVRSQTQPGPLGAVLGRPLDSS